MSCQTKAQNGVKVHIEEDTDRERKRERERGEALKNIDLRQCRRVGKVHEKKKVGGTVGKLLHKLAVSLRVLHRV